MSSVDGCMQVGSSVAGVTSTHRVFTVADPPKRQYSSSGSYVDGTTSSSGVVLAMGAQTRLLTSLASGSGKATAVVACAVMLLAGCGGSGGSATDASTPVIRGDVAGDSGSTVTAPGKPPAPTVVAGDGMVTVTVAAGSGGTPTSYTVYSGGGPTCTVTGASGSCDITGLTDNPYPRPFQVFASNTAGGSDISDPTLVIVRNSSSSFERPGKPPAPTVVAGDGMATVTVAAGSGGTPTSYTVYSGGGPTCTVTGASGSCDITRLTDNPYPRPFQVFASNTAGGSDISDPTLVIVRNSSSTFYPPGTPPAPTVVAGTAKVTATVAAGTAGGPPATYTVTAYTVNETVAGTCTVTGASGFCEVTPLTGGIAYTFTATAKNTAGNSGESVPSLPVTVVAPSSTVTAPAATVPGAPGLTSLSRRSKTEVWVTFSAPSSDGGKPITGYTVTATRNGVNVTQSFPAEAGRVSVGPLTRYAVYTFTVRAVNSVGTSGPSNASRFTVG
jgi:hypothetical protein